MQQLRAGPSITDVAREAGVAFEALFLAAFDAADWLDGRRVTQQAGKDLRRRPWDYSVQRIGATLAILGRERPEALRALFARLEAWALAQQPDTPCLLTAAQHDATQSAEADVALLAAIASHDDVTAIERAIDEHAESLASQQTVLVALHQRQTAVRAVRKRTLIASGVVQRRAQP